jgi:hypothetical protein
MIARAIGSTALLLLATACGGGEKEAANLTNNISAGAAGGAGGTSDAQNQVRALPEGQRNGVLIRAIRDANLNCQHVTQSTETKTSNNVPVYEATCEDGAVYAVAIADDGTATVQPMLPAEGK